MFWVLTANMSFTSIFMVIFAISKSKYIGTPSFKAIGGISLSECAASSEPVRVNENNFTKLIFFRRIFFPNSEKLIFEKENVILFNTFLNLNLFYSIVVNFL